MGKFINKANMAFSSARNGNSSAIAIKLINDNAIHTAISQIRQGSYTAKVAEHVSSTLLTVITRGHQAKTHTY